MVGVCLEVCGWSNPGGDLRRMWGRDRHALRLYCESESEWMTMNDECTVSAQAAVMMMVMDSFDGAICSAGS